MDPNQINSQNVNNVNTNYGNTTDQAQFNINNSVAQNSVNVVSSSSGVSSLITWGITVVALAILGAGGYYLYINNSQNIEENSDFEVSIIDSNADKRVDVKVPVKDNSLNNDEQKIVDNTVNPVNSNSSNNCDSIFSKIDNNEVKKILGLSDKVIIKVETFESPVGGGKTCFYRWNDYDNEKYDSYVGGYVNGGSGEISASVGISAQALQTGLDMLCAKRASLNIGDSKSCVGILGGDRYGGSAIFSNGGLLISLSGTGSTGEQVMNFAKYVDQNI